MSSSAEVFTDGACTGNPGPGGYAAVVRIRGVQTELIFAGGYRRTTNNRMELLAVITGLRAIPQSSIVHVYSDSQYVVKGIMLGWARAWRSKGWIRAKKIVPNWELWRDLLDACDRHARVSLHWVRGHDGHVENEQCDQLAVVAATGDLEIDHGYENPPRPDSSGPQIRLSSDWNPL